MFAQCIRENGVVDFPDPPSRTGRSLTRTGSRPPNSKGGMAAINAAMKKCGEVYADRLGLKKK